MIVEQNFWIGVRDINAHKKLKNSSLLSYLEDTACTHSDKVGYGLSNIEQIKKTWILLSWKVKVIKRPSYSETLLVKTWSRLIEKLYAYRDFEIYNQQNELLAVVTSKWIFIDTENKKIQKITEEVANAYGTEDINVFGKKDIDKLKEPENYINEIDFKITKNLIDINNHLHNIYYLDLAKEAIKEETIFSNEIDNFEIMYKHEITYGQTVKVMYGIVDNTYYVVIKNEDKTKIHAIIKLEI